MAPNVPHQNQARRSFFEDEDDEALNEDQRRRRTYRQRVVQKIKVGVFLIAWLYFTIFIITTTPHKVKERIISLDPDATTSLELPEKPEGSEVRVELQGNIDKDATYNPNRAKKNQSHVLVTLEGANSNNNSVWTSRGWVVYIEKAEERKLTSVVSNLKLGKSNSRIISFFRSTDSDVKLNLLNKGTESTAFSLKIHSNPITAIGVIYAALLLLFLYILIIFDITDRTFAALLSATLGIGVLCMIHLRPTLKTIISWIDMETLMLLFGMMIIVSVLAETGVFDYLAVCAYRVSKGQAWVLIFLLCMLTVVLSGFLDNVTIVMLMVPVIIRLTENMGLRTTSVLIYVVIFSNIGGALTPIGDPPNAIIATNAYVMQEGVNFVQFVVHMFPGVVLGVIIAWFYMYLVMRNRLYHQSDDEMRESIKNLAKVADKLATRQSEEDLREEIVERIDELKKHQQASKSFGLTPTAQYIETLALMKSKYKITNMPLLIKCGIALTFAILLFTLNSLPFLKGITLAWAALLAAILLLILANKGDLQDIFDHIEWSTLLFFASLFVLVECVSELGLIDFIGEVTNNIIADVERKHRLISAVMLVLWISLVFSCFIDNIPIVTMMLKLVIKISTNDKLHVSMLPMIWALSYGVCFGGNGTLIAATSNIVAAGIASQHGYKITFMEFFKYGFPITLVTALGAAFYLSIAHGLFHWHKE